LNDIAPSSRTLHASQRAQIRHDAAVRCDERQRIGRELHDSTSQLLVALQLNIACLKVNSENADTRQLFCALDQTLQQLHSEVRAVSSCNETPTLHGTFPLALRPLAAHFALLANIKVTVEMQGDYVPQAADVEMSLYRIAQEALANIVRHAHATEVRLQVACTKEGTLKLTIEDDGVGLGSCRVGLPKTGTGIGNIRQRARDMGGHLILRRLQRGLRVAVTIPLLLPAATTA
jgi:two-component system, NarL family, sensor kinase